MSTMIREPHHDLLEEQGGPPDDSPPGDEVRTQVWGLLSTLYPQHDLTERRHENRYPFPYLVQLTPVAEDGITPRGESVVVVGNTYSTPPSIRQGPATVHSCTGTNSGL